MWAFTFWLFSLNDISESPSFLQINCLSQTPGWSLKRTFFLWRFCTVVWSLFLLSCMNLVGFDNFPPSISSNLWNSEYLSLLLTFFFWVSMIEKSKSYLFFLNATKVLMISFCGIAYIVVHHLFSSGGMLNLHHVF